MKMPLDAALPLVATAWHPADIANVQANLAKDREAIDTLLAIERTDCNG